MSTISTDLADLAVLYSKLRHCCQVYELDPEAHPFVKHWAKCLKETRPEDAPRMMYTLLTSFNLLTDRSVQCFVHVPFCNKSYSRNVGDRGILMPDFLAEAESHLYCTKADACKLPNSKRQVIPRQPALDSCKRLRLEQKTNVVRLKLRNLCTLLYHRYLDSAVLDAWLHGLHRNFATPDDLYIISAENDPTMDALRDTRSCYAYLLLFLFRKKHWTVMFINHSCQEIFYYNSQTNPSTVEKQLAPYQATFPEYQVRSPDIPQQIDRYSCGVFCAWFAYCLLFCPELMHAIRPDKAAEMREAILRQLLIWYVV